MHICSTCVPLQQLMMKEERLAGFDGADDDVGDSVDDIVDIVDDSVDIVDECVDIVDDSVVIILMILLIYGTSRAPF